MIHLYGNAPYKIILIHGGPGALGSLKPVAEVLAQSCGVIEQLQTKYDIAKLLAELHEDMTEITEQPIILLGHSWGAWLALLYAAEHPQMVKRLVLVGCAPLESQYVQAIQERRKSKLSPAEQELFAHLLLEMDDGQLTAADNAALTALLEKTDNYDAEVTEDVSLSFDFLMYARVWQEAEELREKGILCASLKQLSAPVIVIHDDVDPHPLAGVVEPLKQTNAAFHLCRLTKCGHYPYQEKFAKKEFYEILQDLLNS